MFEGLKDMGKLVKQAKEMKSKMKDVQNELKTLTVEGAAAKGKIVVTMTGELECTNVKIDADLLQDKYQEQMQKALAKAFNEAATKAKGLATDKLSVISKGMNIPGLS